MKSKQSVLIILLYQLLFLVNSFAQTPIAVPKNEYGLPEVTNIKTYKLLAGADSNQVMINLQQLIPGIVLDLRYACVNNFMHRIMYPSQPGFSFLRRPAADALAKVETELNTKGLGLKVFDAYRPFDVTKKFWELVPDERYAANPAKGSGHNRGIAADLTIIDLQSKKELDMGTGFDNFTDSAHHAFTALDPVILNNRKLLKETMEKYGFMVMPTEWWHYSWPNPEHFEILNLSFNDLKKATE